MGDVECNIALHPPPQLHEVRGFRFPCATRDAVARHATCTHLLSVSCVLLSEGSGPNRVVFASSCGDVVRWLQPDWVLVLDGNGTRSATLHYNPNRGAPASTFQPRITSTVSNGDEGDSAGNTDPDVRSACQDAWSLKRLPDIKVTKTVMDKTGLKPQPLTIQVATDEATRRASEAFDYEFDGKSEFQQPALPPYPADFSVGVLVGPSGSGPAALDYTLHPTPLTTPYTLHP